MLVDINPIISYNSAMFGRKERRGTSHLLGSVTPPGDSRDKRVDEIRKYLQDLRYEKHPGDEIKEKNAISYDPNPNDKEEASIQALERDELHITQELDGMVDDETKYSSSPGGRVDGDLPPCQKIKRRSWH